MLFDTPLFLRQIDKLPTMVLSKLFNSTTLDTNYNALKNLISSSIKLAWKSIKSSKSELKGKEVVLGFLVVLIGVNVYYRRKLAFWSHVGIKSPPTLAFLGNYHQVILKHRGLLDLEWSRKYGKVYGIYIGTKPILACADIDVINKLCIKDFNYFRNHWQIGIPNRYEKNLLFMMKGDEWHRMRSVLSPTFSGAKIKTMFKLMDRCTQDLLDTYDRKLEQSASGKAVLDPLDLFRSFGTSVSLSSFYSFSVDSALEQSGNEKTVALKKLFTDHSRDIFSHSLLRTIMTVVLPEKFLLALGFSTAPTEKMQFFHEKTLLMIEERRKSGKKYNDYLQILLDLEQDQSRDEVAISDDAEAHHSGWEVDESLYKWKSPANSGRIKFTGEQISANALTFLMFSGETIGGVIASMVYILSFHPEIQSKLREELRKALPESPEQGCNFDYELLTSCRYLDCVVSECLRFMPPTLYSDRVAEVDYYIEKYNCTIPAGTTVQLCYYAVMHDPDYWPEPDKFNPDRFLPENRVNIKPGTYCPFGIGPRFCLAFRFALTETKVALARLILSYRYEPAPMAKFPPEPAFSPFLANKYKNLLVSVSKLE